MVSRPAATALLLVHLLALGAFAQAAEFGRAASGEIVLTPKGSGSLSGSLELSLPAGSDVFGVDRSPAYGITAGGTLIQDRLWFFAAASRQETSQARFAGAELPDNAAAGAIGGRVSGRVAGGHDFSAFFEAARRPELSGTTPAAFGGVTPSSFLSLRYTGVVSDNMLFSASFSRSSRRVQGLGLAAE